LSRALEGKKIVVTGASRGLGKAVAELFSKEGAEVAILARNEKELKGVADNIVKSGGNCIYFPADVGDYMQVKNVFQEIRRHWDKLDALINNAAVGGPITEVSSVDTQDWDKTIKINLSGPFYCVKEALGILVKADNSCIINLTSSLAKLVWPRFTAYGATKGGLNSMTLYLADELKHQNIRVFGLDPGAMDTPMMQALQVMNEEQVGKVNWETIKVLKENNGFASPHDLAKLVLFVVTKAPMELTGKIGGDAFYKKHGFKF